MSNRIQNERLSLCRSLWLRDPAHGTVIRHSDQVPAPLDGDDLIDDELAVHSFAASRGFGEGLPE